MRPRIIACIVTAALTAALVGCAADRPRRSIELTSTPGASQASTGGSPTSNLPAAGIAKRDDGKVVVTGRLVYRTAQGGYFAIVDAPPAGPMVGDERIVGVIVLEEGDRHGGDLQPLVDAYVQFTGRPVEPTSENPLSPQFVPETMRILGDGTAP